MGPKKKGGSAWCSAPNCKHSRDKGWKMHRFPKNEARCKQWVQNLGREDLFSKSTDYLNTNCHLCSDHFEDNQYWNVTKKAELGLLPTAVPTIFNIPDPPPGTAARGPEDDHSHTVINWIKPARAENKPDGDETNQSEEDPDIEFLHVAATPATPVALAAAAAAAASRHSPVSSPIPEDIKIELVDPDSQSGDNQTIDNSPSIAEVSIRVIGSSLLKPKSEGDLAETENGKDGEPVEEPLWSRQQDTSPEKTRTGFKSSFLQSPAYLLWRHVGDQHQLKEDEDIASFLLKFYANASSMLLSGLSACPKCKNSLSLCCAHCQHVVVKHSSSTGLLEFPASDVNKSQSLSDSGGADRMRESGSEVNRRSRTKKAVTGTTEEPTDVERVSEKPGSQRKRKRQDPRSRQKSGHKSVNSSSGKRGQNSVDDCIDDNIDDNIDVFFGHGDDDDDNDDATVSKCNENSSQTLHVETPGAVRTEAGEEEPDSFLLQKIKKLSEHLTKAVSKPRKPRKKTSKTADDPQKMAEITESGEKRFSCDTCGRSYFYRKNLYQHHRRKHATTTFKCTECGRNFSSEENLQTHFDRQHTVKEIKCDVCGKTFTNNHSLKLHRLLHTGQQPFVCEICGKAVLTKLSLSRHMQIHTQQKEYLPCDVCSKVFDNPDALKRHKKRHSDFRFVCDICGKAFFRAASLKQHQRTHREDKYLCDVCNMSFTDRTARNEHRAQHPEKKPFACDLCGKSYTAARNLWSHKRSHSGLKPFPCDECGKFFSSSTTLRRHKVVHSDVKPFSCEICSASFKLEYLYKYHKKLHAHQMYPHQISVSCGECGKTFKSHSSLYNHKLAHSANRKWVCDVCNKGFLFPSNLEVHKRIHTGFKPFCCNVCGKRFTASPDLKKHMRTHTGEKPFSCSVCYKRFAQKAHLEVHHRTHTGVKPYACDICAKKFAEPRSRKKHMEKDHPAYSYTRQEENHPAVNQSCSF